MAICWLGSTAAPNRKYVEEVLVSSPQQFPKDIVNFRSLCAHLQLSATVAQMCRTKVVCDLRTNLEFQSQFWEDTNCVHYFTPAISKGYYEFQITVRALYSRKQRWHGSVGRKLCTRDEKETARNYSIWPASLPQRTLNHWLWGLLMSVQLICTTLKECPKRRI